MKSSNGKSSNVSPTTSVRKQIDQNMINYLNIESTRFENPRYVNLNTLSSKSSLCANLQINHFKNQNNDN